MVGDTRHIAWRRALAAACLLLAPVAVTESPDHPHYRGLRFPCLPHLGSAPQDLNYSFNRRGDYGGTTSVRTTKASPVKRPVKMLSQLGGTRLGPAFFSRAAVGMSGWPMPVHIPSSSAPTTASACQTPWSSSSKAGAGCSLRQSLATAKV